MINYIVSVLVFTTLIVPHLNGQEGIISLDERKFLFDYLEITERHLLKTFDTVNSESWFYKPEDGGWSIAECLDHILLAEGAVFSQLKAALQKDEKPLLTTRNQDAWLISKISDRGVKVTTPLPPQDNLRTKQVMIETLIESRKQIRTFLSNKNLPLRTHFGESPYGPADAYQLALVIAAHSMRHHGQILEVLAEHKRKN